MQYYHRGAPTKEDKEGNTPLHLACRFGSLEIVHRLLSKYNSKSMTEVNSRGITPLGYALSGNHYKIARLFMKLSLGNPAQKFPDFRQHFPSLSKEQSLDHPVGIFVMGNRSTGKSTLIKSLQVKGAWNLVRGVFLPTTGVDHHSGGIVPSDVSSSGYGRVKFYELASCHETMQEGIFLSLEKPIHSLFIITVSYKEKLKKIEASLLFWLSFIHQQYRSESSSIRPSIAVVASFLFYNKIGALRLDNRTRLRIAYHRVLNQHYELCSCFNFLGKFSMDCRRSESPGMRQLRNVLCRKCNERRPVGGEKSVPSSCYTLLNGLKSIGEHRKTTPVMRLSNIEHHITECTSTGQPKSLLSLLPAHAGDLKPLLECLEERKAIFTLKHLSPRDPWVIYDEYKLISQIDSTLVERLKKESVVADSNPAVMEVEKLLECLSPLSLSKGVLMNILHHFRIIETMSDREATKYLVPSILREMTHNSHYFNSWLPNDKYLPGFAWCIIPQPNQIMPFFMPHFLYRMLYELYATAVEGDMDTVIMSHLGLYCTDPSGLEICLTVDSSMVNLNMRCKKREEITCLQYRNKFLSAIHQLKEKYQPTLEIREYIISMKAVEMPIRKQKQVTECGKVIDELRRNVITQCSNENIENYLYLEPCVWCRNLSQAHLRNLLNPALTDTLVSNEFLQDLKEQMQDKFDVVCGTLGIYALGDELPDVVQYGQVVELFSTISIFQTTTQFHSALKVRLM